LKRHPAFLASAALGLLVVAVGGGCSFGESGIAPPTNRIFLPGGMVADPDADFLYIVNSNSDLRFNAGTVVAVDLARIAQLSPTPPLCTKTRFSRTESVPDDYCCRDMVDGNIINCHEAQLIQEDATIKIGSYGGSVALHRVAGIDGVASIRRLFVAVRAEPSITYADITGTSQVALRCTGPHSRSAPAPARNPFCDESWRVRRPGGSSPGSLALPEEPHVIALDEIHKALFVGHLTVSANSQLQGGGISALDICDPEDAEGEHPAPVRFAGLARTAFLPTTISQAVAMLSIGDDEHPLPSPNAVFATARSSTAISGMVLRATPDPGFADCSVDAARDLTLIPGEHFFSSAFLPNGTDVRGIWFSGNRAFVLHRNDSDTLANPAAVVVLDRQSLSDGTPSDSPIAILQVCNGPTAMQMKDVGRGDRLFVTCYDEGLIYVIDPDALVVTGTIDVGAAPTSLVFSTREPGIAYVASFANNYVSRIDLRRGSPTENRVLLRIGLPHWYGE
jgi:hypothetical protein